MSLRFFYKESKSIEDRRKNFLFFCGGGEGMGLDYVFFFTKNLNKIYIYIYFFG